MLWLKGAKVQSVFTYISYNVNLYTSHSVHIFFFSNGQVILFFLSLSVIINDNRLFFFHLYIFVMFLLIVTTFCSIREDLFYQHKWKQACQHPEAQLRMSWMVPFNIKKNIFELTLSKKLTHVSVIFWHLVSF